MDIATLTLEETRALAWTADQKVLLFLAIYSDDPQTLAIVARMTEKAEGRDNDLVRGRVAKNPATSTQTLNYLSTFMEALNCGDVAVHPNTPDEALRRMLFCPDAFPGYSKAILRRENINMDIALDAATLAQEHGYDPSYDFKAMLFRELEKPVGAIVSIDAVKQLRARTRPDIPALTLWARKRTENWDARTIAAFEVLKDTEGLDRDTLCLAVEELAASKQAPERKGDPVEKSAQAGPAQSI